MTYKGITYMLLQIDVKKWLKGIFAYFLFLNFNLQIKEFIYKYLKGSSCSCISKIRNFSEREEGWGRNCIWYFWEFSKWSWIFCVTCTLLSLSHSGGYFNHCFEFSDQSLTHLSSSTNAVTLAILSFIS